MLNKKRALLHDTSAPVRFNEGLRLMVEENIFYRGFSFFPFLFFSAECISTYCEVRMERGSKVGMKEV